MAPSQPPGPTSSVCVCFPPSSSHVRKHARHPSLWPPPLPVFPSPLCLPSISRPSPFTFHFSASASHSFFSHALPHQTASITSSVTRLIGSGERRKKKEKKHRRQSRLRWNGKRINHCLCFRGGGGRGGGSVPTSGSDGVMPLGFHKSHNAPREHRAVAAVRPETDCDLWNHPDLLSVELCGSFSIQRVPLADAEYHHLCVEMKGARL